MEVVDQINHTIQLNTIPKRIISLVPSQTELLFDLGLDKEVVGITKFCIHPDSWFRSKSRVGGTKTLNIAKIKELLPDLIIANKEENTKEEIEALQQFFPVYTSNISNLKDSLEMIQVIGKITNTEKRAEIITSKIQDEFKTLNKNPSTQKSVLYLIWKDPYMSIGNDSFIHDMLSRCGWKNVFSNQNRYPVITKEEIKEIQPELILLSSEPYPFKEKNAKEMKQISPSSNIILVDGELFSWYGSRLQYSPSYFSKLLKKVG